ncbi:hypothetical protein C1645_877173 [Glomus cerebriforme]|uniref:Uncharacterized protein n=1 Tax=Glomus cerebriforme TaxID=658196 RepID=A0A397SVV0_9GLOM|nr:hypothetical protein C1645_877173 [Glomus cerebriforme]
MCVKFHLDENNIYRRYMGRKKYNILYLKFSFLKNMSKRWNQPGKSGNVNMNPGFKSYLDSQVVRGDLNKKSDKGTTIYYSGEKKNISNLHLTSNTDGTGAHWSGKVVGHASFSSDSIGKGHEWANNAQKAYHQGETLGKAAKEAASKAASKEVARKAAKEAASKAASKEIARKAAKEAASIAKKKT